MKTALSYKTSVRSLIIDDELDICYLLGNILRRKNIPNNYANNLADSRQLLEGQHFDFLFLDNHLPDGNGIDFIPYLKETFPQMKIILITAYTDLLTPDKSDHAGVDYYLPKPLHIQSIDTVLNDILKER